MVGDLLEIADHMRALATTGLHYAESEFDRERYQQLMGLAARLAAVGEGSDPAEIERIYRRIDDGYVTPKLDVRMAIFRGNTILLVRERSDKRWAMPGGYVDVGDSPSEAAVRETAEEAGLDVVARGLVGVFDGRLQPDAPAHLFHIHKLIFTGEPRDPKARPLAGDEVSDAQFCPLDALPELSLGRTLPLHIREARRVAEDPSELPYFD